MSEMQKVIKYLAIAFAIFLIIAIISGIVAGGYGIIKASGLVKSDKNIISESIATISDNVEEISSLKIEIKGTDMQIVKGDKLEVRTNNTYIKYSNENGNVVIKDERPDNFFFGGSYEGNVIISIPENMKEINDTEIKIGAGKIFIDKLYTKKLRLDIGAGETTINNLEISNEAKIEGGAGAIHINSGKIHNLYLETGMGAADVTADIIGNSKLETGVGTLYLNLYSGIEKYRISAEKGLGDIRCNNQPVSDHTTIGTWENYIKIEGGVGQITITTNNK